MAHYRFSEIKEGDEALVKINGPRIFFLPSVTVHTCM